MEQMKEDAKGILLDEFERQHHDNPNKDVIRIYHQDIYRHFTSWGAWSKSFKEASDGLSLTEKNITNGFDTRKLLWYTEMEFEKE